MHVSILEHFQHLYFDLSTSLKVKCDGGIRLPIYDFLLLFNRNIWHNSTPLRDISLQNLSDLDTDLSSALKVNMIAWIVSLDSPYMLPYCLIVTELPNSAPLQDIRL